jgi:hypothetical protein
MCSEICRCFSQCQQGHGEEILAKYKSLPCPAAVQCQRVANNEDSESDSDADESIVSVSN